MRFLANENMPGRVIAHLRQAGHDVVAAKESLRGATDALILTQAQAEQRVLLTQDKDFGELAFRSNLPAECGIVLFRLNTEDPEEICQRMISVLDKHADWQGTFSVVDDWRLSWV